MGLHSNLTMNAMFSDSQAGFPTARPRRLRQGVTLRRMVRETRLSVDQLVLPMFAIAGHGHEVPIDAMPGHARMSSDLLAERAARAFAAGVPAVLLFGVTEHKDELGTKSFDPHGEVQEAIGAVKRVAPEMVIITDVCLCEYTSHGHCGILRAGQVDNDVSLEALARAAVSHADAGADIVAPSDMMDGRVGAIRAALDSHGHQDVAILSYAAKYASGFYGPFREAAGSTPSFGDRRGYQMDPANGREALREVALDIAEGADMVMVKPAVAYLDVVAAVRQITTLPVAAYHVSGEFSMIKAAAARGWLDERTVALEVLTGITRAGADLVITYYAEDAAAWLKETL
jgi:porphobilinogen synthase